MKVTQIMKTYVVTTGMDTKLSAVQRVFDRRKFHHILIVEDDELLGVVSDRDILKQLSPFLATAAERPQDLSTLDKLMHQIMTRKPITGDTETTVEEAVNIFVSENISCLPILSEEQKVIGIVTWKDILKRSISQKRKRRSNNFC